MSDKKLSEIGTYHRCMKGAVNLLQMEEDQITMTPKERRELVRRVWEAARGGEYHSNAGVKWIWDYSIESFIEKEGL